MKRFRVRSKIIPNSFSHFLLPIVVVLFFILFLYANNVEILILSDLYIVILPGILISILISAFFYFTLKKDLARSAIASIIFILLFFLYGILFDFLRKINIIQVENYTLLPIYLISGVYVSLLTQKIPKRHLKTINFAILIVMIGLIVLNLLKIIPSEIQKANLKRESQISTTVESETTSLDYDYPDIYFIILDEAAGFNVIRDYFGYAKVDDFVGFLKDHQFYVAENSSVAYPETLYAMASRLNYQQYDEREKETFFFDALTNNQVMSYLKGKGYSTAVFDEVGSKLTYANKPPTIADYVFKPETTTAEQYESKKFYTNQFLQLVINQTVFKALNSNLDLQHPVYLLHKAMIFYTMDKMSNLDEVSHPRFVYVHLMLPHVPFMFDEHGNENYQKYFFNWDYYLGNYKFALNVAESVISTIINKNDSNREPIIILQSDHGARNGRSDDPDSKQLQNYPDKYKTQIINAIRIPGCPDAPLSQDMNPINTFPIIFNCLFDAEIPLQ